MKMSRAAKPLILIVLVLATVLAPVFAADTANAYQEILDAVYVSGDPGASAIVVEGGKVLFLGAQGMADMELQTLIEADMVFRLGSITKQFTAAAIMMLVEEGKVALDDPLTKFLPDYPEAGKSVRVEHLLTHTSGIVSYTSIPGYMATEVMNELSVENLVAVFKDLPVEFAPGERFAYNNSGYVLLGAIIESVSGMSYEVFIQQRIFEPLGMKSSYYGNHARIVPRRVSGYGGAPGEYENAPYLSMTQPYAAGSLLSTVEDMQRWNTALFGGKVVSEASLKKMITPYELTDGNSTGYGYGLGVADVRGNLSITHGGGIHGFSTSGLYLPERQIYVAVLSNNTGPTSNPSMVSTRMAALALGSPYPVMKAVAVDAKILKGYTGVYKIDDESDRVVTFEDGKLFTQRTGGGKRELSAASDTRFFYTSTLSWIEMQRGEEGVWQMLMHQGGAEDADTAVRVGDVPDPRTVVDVDPAVLLTYVGEYELMPGFSLTIRADGSQLFAQATGQPEFELFAESETEFFLKVVDAQVIFILGEDIAATSLVLQQGGQELPGRKK